MCIFNMMKVYGVPFAVAVSSFFAAYADEPSGESAPASAYRPLVEEYTGLWCTACPSGYVAMEECSEKYGSEFVAIAYHVNDEIQSKAVTLPVNPKGVPAAYFNRRELTGGVWDIPSSWENARDYYTDDTPVPAEIGVEIEWTSLSRSQLRARAKVKFAEEHKKADYYLAYCLVADGLKKASWAQANRFGGMNYSGKYWDLFTRGGAYVYGLTFNNVPCIFNNPQGIEGSLPRAIEAGKEYVHEYMFTLSDAVTRQGNLSLIQDKDKLRVIAILLDAGGKTVNSVSSAYSADAPFVASGVDVVYGGEETPIVSTDYYSLQGERIEAPMPGLPCIRVEYLADGTIRSRKMLFSR